MDFQFFFSFHIYFAFPFGSVALYFNGFIESKKCNTEIVSNKHAYIILNACVNVRTAFLLYILFMLLFYFVFAFDFFFSFYVYFQFLISRIN